MPKPAKLTPKPLPEFISELGPRLAALRKKSGFSQDAFAEQVGITKKQISDYENGKANINHEMVIRFALALGVSTDEFLGLKDVDASGEAPSLRFTRRMRELDQLPEAKKKAILKTLDDLIRANS